MAESRNTNPSEILNHYRRWKEEGEALKSQAQGFLVERFHELVHEAQQVQQDLHEDFGHVVKFPVNPKFAKKGRGRVPQKKSAAVPVRSVGPSPAPAPAPARAGSPSPAPANRSSATQKPAGGGVSLRAPKESSSRSREDTARKLATLKRQVEKATKRLTEAKASGSAVKIQNAEDKLYELSDDLRLMQQTD